jgi:hypothetical protein
MIRKALLVSALAAGAMIGSAPAQASVNFGSVSGLINQLQNNSSFSSNNMQFTICTNGVCQTLFTGLTGLQNVNLNTFNNWAGTGNGGNGGGYFDNWGFTFSGAGSYFGNQSPPQEPTPQTFSILQDAPAVPEVATWAMMLLGFVVVGSTLRRRKTTVINFG